MTEPAAAIVIPAWRNSQTIDLVLGALQGQLRSGDEVVIVESSADGSAADLQQRWGWVRVLAQPRQTYPPAAREIGVAATSAPIIVFLDADAIPDPTWLDTLRESLGTADAAGGSVQNGTPESLVGTASFFAEFMRWLPSARTPDSLINCNLLIRRTTFGEIGGFAAQVWPAEDTLLTYPLMGSGRAIFVPEATVIHLNRTSIRDVLRHQVILGRSFADVCRHGAFRPAILGRRWLAPLTGALRWLAMMARLPNEGRRLHDALRLRMLVTLALGAWTVGLLRGSAGGRIR